MARLKMWHLVTGLLVVTALSLILL